MEDYERNSRVVRTLLTDLERPDAAARPLNSVLDLRKAAEAGVNLPPWRESLAAYVQKECSARQET